MSFSCNLPEDMSICAWMHLHGQKFPHRVTSENTVKDKINIYPNSTSGVFYLDNLKKNNKVSLYDQSGKLVR